jgi:uncharacterized membrane protein YgcG
MSHIPGSSLLSTFDDEVVRRDAARSWIESHIAIAEKSISAANAARESAYAELAEIYAADDGKLAAAFGEISQRVQAIFTEKMKRRAELNTLLEQAARLIANLHEQLKPAQENAQACDRRLDAARRELDAELGADAAFLELKREADGLQAAARQVEAAHARITSECAAKLAGFTANRLFAYLVSVKFGTPDYQGAGLNASGDRWLARLVAWEKNYPSFATLTELPAFAAKRVATAQKTAGLAATRVSFHINEREVARGVTAAKTAVTAAKQALDEVNAQIAKLESQRTALTAELQAIDGGADPFQKRAKAELKAFLTENPIARLKAAAAATANVRDNQLTDEIERAETTVNEGRRRVKTLVAERAVADEQHQRAVTARRKFSSGYSGTYNQFDRGINIGDLLTGYILGSTSERSLWSSVDHHHHDATPSYSYSSSSNDSSFGSFSSGGDSSGGFSGGGGDSGGSFSTGGGD